MLQLFAADDKFPDVVAQLETRGWRRLPFVGCPKFDLKWTNYSKVAWGRVTSQQIVNHLQNSIILSQKDQLTQLLYARENGDQTQVDHYLPRTFELRQPLDRRLLKFWFCYSQAVGVLKDSLNESVKVDEAQVGAAMQLARTVIASNSFLECWRKEEAFNGVMLGDATEWLRLLSIDLELEKASLHCHNRRAVEEILRELERRDPQFHAVGSADSNVWICKPSNLSQGRGIVLCNSFREIEELASCSSGQDGQEMGEKRKSQTKWIIQKYVERPLLLQNGRKFDIRQWVLITKLYPQPTVFWFYKSYLRFCSRRFALARQHDRFVHLSNYSVQQYFEPDKMGDLGQKDSEAANKDPFELMWSSEKFRDTLRQEHGRDIWNDTILPQMQNIARLTLEAALPKLNVVGRGFEWLGFDFLVDENHHVWLLEVNVSPDVSHSTTVTAELVPKATADLFNVILDPETSRSPDNGWLPFSLQSHH
ncbi:hypothetical protein F442_21574 [Phytophthora nicotianae P10297]|uniref:Tubulin-tyrosine ligase n=1 Tax=Phytophthora nicotianae P10297 TaxID=1317064 RepID=W2Y518_PHYNI|nr:hypothetical protein F442_21574 [Phytophthora nicotianae P10297]